ncbi:MAG: DM13 domain-containing protein [Marinobacterium sp.]|nr:DM13 domain-containing protein [Marinobacterium sp.]
MRLLLMAVVIFSAGFAAGMYSLPILQAARLSPPVVVGFTGQEPARTGQFRDDLPGNDFLHWGRGQVRVTDSVIAFEGVELAPGPDYRLYLLPEPVEDEAAFLKIKSEAVNVAAVQTFRGNAQYALPVGIDSSQYQAVLVWCEAFGEFITMAEL